MRRRRDIAAAPSRSPSASGSAWPAPGSWPRTARALPALTVSIGVAVFPVRTSSPEDLIGHADAALYAAKRAGKDRVETYG